LKLILKRSENKSGVRTEKDVFGRN
jgi:hypothetical protein